jgi:hypothetical protein
MERLTEMQREAESIMTSANGNINDDETELSDEEVECAIQREEAQETRRSPISSGKTSPVDAHVQHDMKTEETDSEIDPNVTSYRADLSAEHIEIARIGVRASAQLLTMNKGSVSVLGVDRSYSASTAPGERFLLWLILGYMLIDGMCLAECNLPSEMPRASESGFVGLKHSVKASIGVSFLF